MFVFVLEKDNEYVKQASYLAFVDSFVVSLLIIYILLWKSSYRLDYTSHSLIIWHNHDMCHQKQFIIKSGLVEASIFKN